MSLHLIERQSLSKQILALAERVGYTVRVNKIDNNKALTLFPNRLFGHPKYENIELVHEIEKSGTLFIVKRFDTKWRTFTNLEDYMVRPFIIQDIYLKCGLLGIDQELVLGYDIGNSKTKTLIEAIPEPENVDKNKEILLAKSYILRNGGIEVPKDKLKTIINGLNFIDTYVTKTVKKYLDEEIFE